MAIKRYRADADTTIVNAFQPGLKTRGTGANMGEADVSEPPLPNVVISLDSLTP